MQWWIIASLCAFFIKGLCGFANTLVFTTILTFANTNASISPVELVLGYPTNFILVWKERKNVRAGIWVPLALMVLAGSLPGVLVLKNGNSNAVKILFGVVLIVVSIDMLYRERHQGGGRQNQAVMAAIGILSGLLCGLYGVGALLSAYVSRVTEDISSFKANICMVFMVESTFRIILYTAFGIITAESVKKAAVLFPFMLVGLATGMVSGKFLNEKTVRKCVIFLLLFSGLALVINNF